MNITFLVGNGFDINLGLKTRYTDFYPFYLSKKHDDIISRAIANNYERWADLELALGQLLKEISPEQIDEFLDSKANLELDLAEYLRLEQQRIDVTSTTIQNEFQKNITGFYNEFPANEKFKFLGWQKQIASAIFYQFISFNYTNSLDRIVDLAKQKKQFGSHSTSIQNYNDAIVGVVHLHGTLSGNMILGLDNERQIGNSGLQASVELKNYIIKPTVNEALGEGTAELVKQRIDDSDYVCVYGMSLGDTDCMWWKYLVDWLNKKSTRKLVLYMYEKETANPSGPEKLRLQDKWKNRFLKTSDTNPENQNKIRSQIIVVLWSKIFDFSDVKLESKDIDQEFATV